MKKTPLQKELLSRLTCLRIKRNFGSRLTAIRPTTRARSAASLALIALMAVVSYTTSSASSIGEPLRRPVFSPSGTVNRSSANRSALSTRQQFRVFANPAQDAERANADLNIARKAHTATTLSDGRVLIAGGENSTGQVEDSELYDPAARTFSLFAKLNISRADHTATRLADGRILITGGHNRDGSLRSTELFDSGTNAFSRGPSLTRARSGHTATMLADGRFLIAGGDSEGTAEIFDPGGMTFTRVKARMAAPRSSHSAILLKSGQVLIAGGLSPDGGELRSGELFDPESLQFKATRNSMLGVRTRPTLRVLPDGKVQIIGGDDEGSMEMFNAEGRYFTARAQVLADPHSQTGIAEVLRAPSRAALINNHGSLRQRADGGVSGHGEILARLLDRSEHTITEIPETFSTLVTGGISGNGITLMSAMTTSSSSATVTTDRTDYQPGDTVIIAGANWQAGETVQLTLHRDNDTLDTVLTAFADQDGNISNSDYVVQESDLNVAFLLTAVGQSSGYTAQTTFTDSRTINSVTLIGGPSVTVAPGATITAIVNVSTSLIGGTNWRSTSWRIATTPPGTTTCVDHPNHDAVGVFGEIISITAPSSPGVYNAYFIAFQENDCTTGPSSTFVLTNAVTVVLTCTAPTIACPPAVTVQCDPNVLAPATDLASFVTQGGSASPSSPSCGPVTVAFVGDAASGSCPKTITRTYRATDAFGNQSTCTQTITVNDTTPPSITCPPPVAVQCDAYVPAHATDLAGFVAQGGGASDNCGTPTLTFVGDAPSGFCPKIIARTYKATDSCGNQSTCTQIITVRDTIAPVLNCPSDITVRCPDSGEAVVVYELPTATDNCMTPSVVCSPPSGSVFHIGATRVTCSATDACGNTGSCSFTVSVNYDFLGFFWPVENPSVINKVKAGQIVPVKFRLTCGESLISELSAVMDLQSANLPACVGNGDDPIPADGSGSPGLRYDYVDNQFVFNWKTEKSWANTCRKFILTLRDGTVHEAYFRFKR